MSTTRRWIAACTLFLLLAVKPASAQPALPDGLRHVPADARAFVHVRVGDLLKSDIAKSLMQRLAREKDGSKFIEEFNAKVGMPLADIDSVTVVMMGPPGLGFSPKSIRIDKESMIPFMGDGSIRKATPATQVDLFNKELEKYRDRDKEPEPTKEIERKKLDSKDKNEVSEQPVAFEQEPLYDYRAFTGGVDPRFAGLDFGPEDAIFGWEPLLIVTSSKALNRKQLLQRLAFTDRAYRRGKSIVILSDRSFMLGVPGDLFRYASHVAKEADSKKPAPLTAALALGADTKHVVVAGGHVPATVKKLLALEHVHRSLPDHLAPFAAFINTPAGLTMDLGKSAQVNIHLYGPNERSAALAANAAKTALAALDLGLDTLLDEKRRPKEKNRGDSLKDVVKHLSRPLNSAKVSQKGSTAHVHLSMELEPTLVATAIDEAVTRVRQAAARTQHQHNLHQIGAAMHNYHADRKVLPPAGIGNVRDKNAKPLLSWRVALLPYLDQENIYRELRLDEPWDSPHNKKFIDKMPAIYAAPGVSTKEPGLTHYQVFVGPGTAFESRLGQFGPIGIRFSEITDGTSNTLMVVEAAEPVIWTKPDDVPYDPQKPLPKLGGLYGNSFSFLFCDGSVRTLPADIPEAVLRALITRNGGEGVSLDY